MKTKKLPRLWCALQGVLPLEACLAAQAAELAWPPEPAPGGEPAASRARKQVEKGNAHRPRTRQSEAAPVSKPVDP